VFSRLALQGKANASLQVVSRFPQLCLPMSVKTFRRRALESREKRPLLAAVNDHWHRAVRVYTLSQPTDAHTLELAVALTSGNIASPGERKRRSCSYACAPQRTSAARGWNTPWRTGSPTRGPRARLRATQPRRVAAGLVSRRHP
jgi:hypothetical protein